MDFRKLSRVADTLDGKTQQVSGQGLQVSDQKNPLDALDTRAKVSDAVKTKVIILDSKKIKSIMEGSREDRRKFLSRLTDSQRRRVLQVYQQAKVADNVEPKKLDVILLDDSISNFVFEPTDYNKEILQEVINSNEFSQEIKNFVEKIIEGEFDADNDAELYKAYTDLVDSNGINSSAIKAIDVVSVIPDSVQIKDSISEEIEAKVKQSAKEDVEKWDKKDLKDLQSKAEQSIDSIVKEGYDYSLVSEAYWSEATEQFGKDSEKLADALFESKYGISAKEILEKKVLDDAVEKALNVIEENPYIDENGDEYVPTEDTPILALLSEALTSFAEGDPSKLEELANATIENPEEGEENPEEKDITYDSAVDIAGKVFRGENINQIIDSLQDRVPAFKKYNFRIVDCGLCNEIEPATCTIDVPLTCEEYNAVVPSVTPCFEELLRSQQCAIPSCPSISSCYPTEDKLCLVVNSSLTYYPIGVSAEEIACRVSETQCPREKAEILNKYCVPLYVMLEQAVKADNLNIVDNKFYKRTLRDTAWRFDRTPKCLEHLGVESGTLTKCSDSETQGEVIELFGQKFILSR